MNILELDSYNLADAVKFHDRLNHRLWDRSEHLHPEVHAKLMEIARDFQEFLGVPDLDVKDITISGSNAAYNYTPNSDIDLHLVVDLPEADRSEVYRELFDAKKFQYNETHNIKIGGYDVELYVQNPNQEHHSQGIYSLLRNSWVSVPRRKKADIDDISTRSKYEDLVARIDATIATGKHDRMSELMKKIRAMRQSGLEQQGEFGADNLAFKLLRNNGYIKKLVDAKNAARDLELSLDEAKKKKKKVKYGFGTYWYPGFAFGDEGGGGDGGGGESRIHESPDGVNPSTKMFLEQPEDQIEITVKEFIDFVVDQLGINDLPEIVLHNDSAWSEQNHSFGRYIPELHTLEVNLANRHIMDILRTIAHELVHCKQNQEHALPDQAGDTGSRWENQANAMAGVIMRDYAEHNPRMFENASGYIPRNKKEARDPRYSMAVSVDIKPGQVGKEANKLALNTGRNGEPQLLMKSANLRESRMPQPSQGPGKYRDLDEELIAESIDDVLFEINMSTGSLRREAAKTGAIAGMEFEMIVPNTEGNDDGDLEPDYDQDERCRSIDDAVQFFHDGDYNGRREVERLRERMQNDFQEWLSDKLYQDWERGGEEYLEEWVPNNVDESEWNPEGLEGEAREEALEVYIVNLHADAGSSDAFDEFREENQDSYDESDWLDDEDLDLMSNVENAYDISWPHWTTSGSGEASIEDVAQEFENAIGRDTKASGSYHSGRVPRPSPTSQHYVVEPDGSLDGDNSGDTGLEFVSPPLPIDEILSDLNKVKAWAKEYGCYTNDSTGLHINISVPDYSRENLDFVKLALLMGDKYVLDAFGRTGNTYAKSAMGIIKDAVRNKPEDAARLLDKMKGNLDQLATKAIHSGSTSKYTSINTKDGHIEFRSPGGDWLDDNFDKIENTLLRFTVAMSAALKPEAYREEYLKKLYKLLTEDNTDDSDTIRYFSEYVAGKIPKAALRSFVKQAQLTRQVKRGATSDKKMWWNVSNPGNSYASVEVVASTKEEAIEKALGPDGYPSWANTRSTVVAKPLRPYEEKPQKQGTTVAGRPNNPDGNWYLKNADTDEIIYRFNAVNYQDAHTVLQQWKQENPDSNINAVYGQGRDEPAQAQEIPEVPLDIEIAPQRAAAQEPQDVNSLRPTGPGPWEVANRENNQVYYNPGHTSRAAAETEARTWLSQNGYNPNEFEVRTRETASNRNAAQGSFTGEWKVVDPQGRIIYSFSGVGNNQGDANRVAMDWLRRNPQRMQAGVEVLPVMG